jgi:hypothetical protein
VPRVRLRISRRAGRHGRSSPSNTRVPAANRSTSSGRSGFVDHDLVGLLDVMARRREPVHQFAEIGQQQQAAGVLVEAADRSDDRVAPGPAFREESVNRGTIPIAVGADHSQRLVQHGQQAVRRLHRFPVDPHGGGVDTFAGVLDRDVVAGDAAGADPEERFAAGTIAATRQQLIHARAAGCSGFGHGAGMEAQGTGKVTKGDRKAASRCACRRTPKRAVLTPGMARRRDDDRLAACTDPVPAG